MFNRLFAKKTDEKDHESEDGSNVIEIDNDDSKDVISSSSAKKGNRTPSLKQPSPAPSIRNSRRMIQREYANLFLSDWLHEQIPTDNDFPENVEEWGDYGNLKIIAGKEEYHKSMTDADDIDAWIKSSPLWRRLLLRWTSILALFLILHAIGFILAASYIQYDRDPFVCDTTSCQKISQWLNSSINRNVDPCDNFYQFVCGHYNTKQQADDSFDNEHGLFTLFKTLRSDIQQRMVYGDLLRKSSDSYIFNQVHVVFKSCLNYTARDVMEISDFLQTLNDIGLHPDNSSSDVNHIAFDVWRYTGEIGLFDLKLYVNPYDGLRKYMIDYFTTYHDDVLQKEFEDFTFAFQIIVSAMKITKFSVEEMATAYQMIVNSINASIDATEKGEDLSSWSKDVKFSLLKAGLLKVVKYIPEF